MLSNGTIRIEFRSGSSISVGDDMPYIFLELSISASELNIKRNNRSSLANFDKPLAEKYMKSVVIYVYSLASGPSGLTTPMHAFVISFTLLQPQSCIQRLNSWCRVSSINSTPFSPSCYDEVSQLIQITFVLVRSTLTARPQNTGLPTQQYSAPKAIALNISVPVLIPPST